MKPNLSLDLNKVAEAQKKEDEQIEAQTVAPQHLKNIIIVDLNNRHIRLKMVQYELILELREYLNEHVYTVFFTNYYLEHQGNKLSDYSDLSDLDLIADNKIYMRAQLYDEKSARHHIKKITDLLTTPCVLNAETKPSIETEKFDELQAKNLPAEEFAKAEAEIVKEMQTKQE